MRVVNRTAVSIIAGPRYLDWTGAHDADADKGTLTVARAQPYGTVYLLPEFELEEDVREWVEENAVWLFAFQLAAWTEDEQAWPTTRDLATFRDWFRIDIHSTVVDAGEDDIEGEEI